MTDEKFSKALADWLKEGVPGLAKMRELLKQPGQLERWAELAVRGAARAKRETTKTKPTFLPDNFPDDVEREKAVAYWRKNGRPDLEPRLDQQAERFRTITQDRPTASWSGKWRTFYMNAIDFTRPVAGTPSLTVLPGKTALHVWQWRLEVFERGDPDDADFPKGTWLPDWGQPPGAPGCIVPREAYGKIGNYILDSLG